MADLLWQKPGVAVDAKIQTFLAGDDVILDREFFLHDIAASAAHAEGLQHIGILSADELAGLQRELEVLNTLDHPAILPFDTNCLQSLDVTVAVVDEALGCDREIARTTLIVRRRSAQLVWPVRPGQRLVGRSFRYVI